MCKSENEKNENLKPKLGDYNLANLIYSLQSIVAFESESCW